MSTRTASLPIERGYLLKAWFVVAGIVLAATVAIVIALSAGSTPAGGTGPEPVSDFGPSNGTHQPILVNGTVCGQCR